MLAVALLMNGGPASVYGPRALAAFDEFAPPAGAPSTRRPDGPARVGRALRRRRPGLDRGTEPVPRRRGRRAGTGPGARPRVRRRPQRRLARRAGMDARPVSTSPRSASTRRGAWRRRAPRAVEWVLADVTEYRPRGRGLRPRRSSCTCISPRRRGGSRSGAPRRRSRPAARCSSSGTTSRTRSAGWGGPQDAAVLYGPDDVVTDLGCARDRESRTGPTARYTTDDGDKVAIDVLVRAVRRRG